MLARNLLHRSRCVALQFAEGGLIATSDHPLYCPETRTWAPAGDWALEIIRADLAASRGWGEDHRKVRARLRILKEVCRLACAVGVNPAFVCAVRHAKVPAEPELSEP